MGREEYVPHSIGRRTGLKSSVTLRRRIYKYPVTGSIQEMWNLDNHPSQHKKFSSAPAAQPKILYHNHGANLKLKVFVVVIKLGAGVCAQTRERKKWPL
jgi:hypothetical protein